VIEQISDLSKKRIDKNILHKVKTLVIEQISNLFEFCEKLSKKRKKDEI